MSKIKYIYPLKYIVGKFIIENNIKYNIPEEVVLDCINFISDEKDILLSINNGSKNYIEKFKQNFGLINETITIMLHDDNLFETMKDQIKLPFFIIEEIIFDDLINYLIPTNYLQKHYSRFPQQFQEASYRYLNKFLELYMHPIRTNSFRIKMEKNTNFIINNLSEEIKSKLRTDINSIKYLNKKTKKNICLEFKL